MRQPSWWRGGLAPGATAVRRREHNPLLGAPFEGSWRGEAETEGVSPCVQGSSETHPFWRVFARHFPLKGTARKKREGAPRSHMGRTPCSVTVRACDALTPVALRQRLSAVGKVQCSTPQWDSKGKRNAKVRTYPTTWLTHRVGARPPLKGDSRKKAKGKGYFSITG